MEVKHTDTRIRTSRRIVEAGMHLESLEVSEREIVPASVSGNGTACVYAVIPRS